MLTQARYSIHSADTPTRPLRREKTYTRRIQTSAPGGTVRLIYLSIAPPVCLSRNPFHHSVILLSVCLYSSVIIRQKNVTHTSSPQPIRLRTSLRSEPRGPRRDSHTTELQEITSITPSSHCCQISLRDSECIFFFKEPLLSRKMPNYYVAVIGSSLCQGFHSTVNIRYHLPLAAIIRQLTGMLL